MNNKTLMDNLRSIPDFPKVGINFRDVTTLFKNAECMKIMVDEMYELYKDKGITKIVGIESRGFVMAAALAVDVIEMHIDSIEENDVVLIHDDLLATGGTALATYKLVKTLNPKNIYMNFIIEISDEGLHGRKVLEEYADVTTLITI